MSDQARELTIPERVLLVTARRRVEKAHRKMLKIQRKIMSCADTVHPATDMTGMIEKLEAITLELSNKLDRRYAGGHWHD